MMSNLKASCEGRVRRVKFQITPILARQIIADLGSTNAVSFSSARKNRSLDFHRDLPSTSFRPILSNDALQLAPEET
jgi:hypothetical protein